MKRLAINTSVVLALGLGLTLALALFVASNQVAPACRALLRSAGTATKTAEAYAPPAISVSPNVLTSTQFMNQVVTKPLIIGNGHGTTLTFNIGDTSAVDTVLLLHFDEPAGATTFYDASGNGNHGSCSGTSCPTAGVSGRFGQALSFDGIDDHVIGTIPASAFAGDWTIAAWFRHTSGGTPWEAIFSNAVDQVQTPIMAFHGDHPTWFGINRVGVSPDGVYVDLGDVHYDQWILGVVTKQGSTLSVEALKLGQWLGDQGPTWALNATGQYYVGRQWNGSEEMRTFNGLIDEVVVYDRAVFMEEVEALYLSGSGSSSVPWLSTDPISGAVPANSSTSVQVTFDATGLQPDTYTTGITIQSNDPVTPSVSVPVTMTVLPLPHRIYLPLVLRDFPQGGTIPLSGRCGRPPRSLAPVLFP